MARECGHGRAASAVGSVGYRREGEAQMTVCRCRVSGCRALRCRRAGCRWLRRPGCGGVGGGRRRRRGGRGRRGLRRWVRARQPMRGDSQFSCRLIWRASAASLSAGSRSGPYEIVRRSRPGQITTASNSDEITPRTPDGTSWILETSFSPRTHRTGRADVNQTWGRPERRYRAGRSGARRLPTTQVPHDPERAPP